MNPERITKLLEELRELAQLEDPAFTARTQSKRVCGQAAELIEAQIQEIADLNAQIEVLGEQ